MNIITLDSLDIGDYTVESNTGVVKEELDYIPTLDAIGESINDLITIKDRIQANKKVSRDDIVALQQHADEFAPIASLLEAHHPAMFTEVPSSVNYDVVSESMESSMLTIAFKAIGSFISYLVKAITSLFKWLWETSKNLFKKNSVDSANIKPFHEFIANTETIISDTEDKVNKKATKGLSGKFERDSKRVYDTAAHNFFKGKRKLHYVILEDGGFANSVGEVAKSVFNLELNGFLIDAEDILNAIANDTKVADTVLAKLDNVLVNNAPLISFLRLHKQNVNHKGGSVPHALLLANSFRSVVRTLENEKVGTAGSYTQLINSAKSFTPPTALYDAILLGSDKKMMSTLDKIEAFRKVVNRNMDKPSKQGGYTADEMMGILNKLASITTAFVSINDGYATTYNVTTEVTDGLVRALAGISEFIHSFLKSNLTHLDVSEAKRASDEIDKLNAKLKR